MTSSVISKFILAATVCGLCGTTAACSNAVSSYYSEVGSDSGMSGIDAFAKRDYKKANEIFAKEYKDNPNDLYATLNLADSFSALGDRDNAIVLYQKLAASGKNEHPEFVYPKPNQNPTFTDMACYHLKELQVGDSNCS